MDSRAAVIEGQEAETLARSAELRASELLATAEQVRIATVEEYEGAADWLKQIKARAKAIEEQRVELTKPLNATIKKINDLFRRPADLLQKAEASLKRGMLSYQQAEERKRLVEQERLRELARKEEERLRKLAEARAVTAEKKGDLERAEAIRENVPTIPVPVVAPVTVPKVAGMATRELWKCEVTDVMALVKAVAAGEVPSEAILPNDKYLGQTARALKSNLRWPGVRVWSEESLAVTARQE